MFLMSEVPPQDGRGPYLLSVLLWKPRNLASLGALRGLLPTYKALRPLTKPYMPAHLFIQPAPLTRRVTYSTPLPRVAMEPRLTPRGPHFPLLLRVNPESNPLITQGITRGSCDLLRVKHKWHNPRTT